MDDLIAELGKTNADLAGKFRDALKALDLDGSAAKLAAAEKRAKTAEKLAEKLKADLDAAGKGSDEATKAAQAQAAEAKSLAEKATGELHTTRLRHALERKLGIADEKWSARAVDALLTDYGDGVELDERGHVVGAEKAIEAFKKAEPKWFGDEGDAGKVVQIGTRPGSGPSPAKPSGSTSIKAPLTRADKIAAHKAKMAPAAQKKGA